MKKIVHLTLALIFVSTFLKSQDTTQDGENSIFYITDEENANRPHQPVKGIFKLGSLAYERKISQSVSLSPGFSPSGFTSELYDVLGVSLGLEARYYYNMKKNIAEGKQASNVSGNYVSITPFYGIGFITSITTTPTNIGSLYGVGLTYGNQQRISKRFYWDNGIQLNYTAFNEEDNPTLASAITFARRNNFNITFGGNRSSKTRQSLKPKVRIYKSINYALRQPFNAFSLSYLKNLGDVDSEFRVVLNPQLVSELKIKDSAFSFVQDLRARLVFTNVDGNVRDDFHLQRVLYTGSLTSRYYFNMKRKMKQGKGGNNFSGAYFVAGFAYSNSVEKGSNLFLGKAGGGYQLDIGKSFFVNIELTYSRLLSGRKPDLGATSGIQYLNQSFFITVGKRLI